MNTVLLRSNRNASLIKPPSGSVLYLPLVGDPSGSVATDRSGNKNNGAITGATWGVAPGGAPILDYDGADDLTTVTDAASIQNVFDGGGTLYAVVNPDSDGEGDAGRVYDKRSAGSGHRLLVTAEAGGLVKLSFLMDFSVTDGIWSTTATVLPIGSYSVAVLTYNSSATANNPIIYICNSTGVNTYTVGSGLTEDSTPDGTRGDDSAQDYVIGNNSATAATFDGKIGAFGLMSGIKTLSEITADFNSIRNLYGM